jgi:hypothetical protein
MEVMQIHAGDVQNTKERNNADTEVKVSSFTAVIGVHVGLHSSNAEDGNKPNLLPGRHRKSKKHRRRHRDNKDIDEQIDDPGCQIRLQRFPIACTLYSLIPVVFYRFAYQEGLKKDGNEIDDRQTHENITQAMEPTWGKQAEVEMENRELHCRVCGGPDWLTGSEGNEHSTPVRRVDFRCMEAFS